MNTNPRLATEELSDAGRYHVTWPQPVAPRWSAVPLTSVPRFVAQRLRQGGRGPALLFDDGYELRRDELLDHIERFSGYLASRVDVGDRVVIAIGNRAEFFVALLAVAAVRGVAVTLSPGVRSHDAAYMLNDSGAVLAIVEGSAADVIEGVASQCPALTSVVRLDAPEPTGLASRYGDRRLALDAFDAPVDEILEIGYTSGTTGLPKALAGDHAEQLRFVDDFLRTHPFAPGDRMMSPLQFHYGDPIWLLYASLAVGSPLIAMRRFSVSRFWRVAREFAATHICTIGAIPTLLLTAESSSAEREHQVRYAAAIGVPAAQHRELIHRFGVEWLETYGSSEAGIVICMPVEDAERYVGTGALGIPAPHVTVRLVGMDGAEILGPGEGELEIGGDFHFGGYLGNSKATAEVMHDKWFRSGDLMRRDADGVYYFVGRRKELIRRGGENIAPAEVEAILKLHPAVADAAVVPVADSLRGEEGKAYVELRSGRDFDPAMLAAFCGQRLAAFKVPRYFELRTEPFPRTASQRIPKQNLMVDGAHQIHKAWDREAP